MKITIDIDHTLLQEAMNLTGEPTKVAIIHRALTELVRREKSMKILEYAGKLDLRIDLDAVRGRKDALRTQSLLKKHSGIPKYRGKLDWEGDLNSPQTTCPIFEFHEHAAEFVIQVSTNQGPLWITESGNTIAVLLSMKKYQALLDKIEILSDIALSEAEIASGGGVEQNEFFKELKEKFFP